MKNNCDIIRDLLPLYVDGVCSQDSAKLVEEHLTDCQSCRELLDKLRGEEEIIPGSPSAAPPEDGAQGAGADSKDGGLSCGAGVSRHFCHRYDLDGVPLAGGNGGSGELPICVLRPS